jgi:hypothetical protein
LSFRHLQHLQSPLSTAIIEAPVVKGCEYSLDSRMGILLRLGCRKGLMIMREAFELWAVFYINLDDAS